MVIDCNPQVASCYNWYFGYCDNFQVYSENLNDTTKKLNFLSVFGYTRKPLKFSVYKFNFHNDKLVRNTSCKVVLPSLQDKNMMSPFLLPLVIIGSKFDIFQQVCVALFSECFFVPSSCCICVYLYTCVIFGILLSGKVTRNFSVKPFCFFHISESKVLWNISDNLEKVEMLGR